MNRMKKHINTVYLIVCLLLLLTACSSNNNNINSDVAPEPSSTQTQLTIPASTFIESTTVSTIPRTPQPPATSIMESPVLSNVTPIEQSNAEPENVPRIIPPADLAKELRGKWAWFDGSTATMPLTTKLHNFFDGYGNPPEHNKTFGAYAKLLYGDSKIIFVTYRSKEELGFFRGVELELIPVVKDALVFLVNVENPIFDISTDQLQSIYTGKTKNWKELGGSDEEIIPYQRPEDSGSQTSFMKLLMNRHEPMAPPETWVVKSMGGLVDVVSSYNNAPNAIGYSMFYFVNNMYGNSRFKLLSVDGVKPTHKTIANGSYPLTDHYYAVIRKSTPTDSPFRKLISWLLTTDGQTIMAQEGYIPLQPLDSVFPNETVDSIYLGDVHNSSGTGGKKPKSNAELHDIMYGDPDTYNQKPLSDLFYDGFNYIKYINDEIIKIITSSGSGSHYGNPFLRLDEDIKQPFTGIPNDYPHYRLGYYSAPNPLCLCIELPENNPFFESSFRFYIPLPSDISPYGTGSDYISISYDNGRFASPNYNLIGLIVDMPHAPEIAERINSQLKEWADGFSVTGKNAKMLNPFGEKIKPDIYGSRGSHLEPLYGFHDNYLSVCYNVEAALVPTICFDITTGEVTNLVEHLPVNYCRLDNKVFSYARKIIAESPSNVLDYCNEYHPAEGTVILKAYFDYGYLQLLIAEPNGDKYIVQIEPWDSQFSLSDS